MSPRKRITVGLVLMTALAGVYVWQFGVQTADALLVRYKFRGLAKVSYSPRPLADMTVAEIPHITARCSGSEYELPWDDIDVSRNKAVGTICVTAFYSGNAFWFSTFPPRDFVGGLQKEFGISTDDFRRDFGEKASESDYVFMERMLGVQPSQITPIVSPATANFLVGLLFLKAMAMPPVDAGIYSFEVHDFSGFQFENRKRARFQIEDDLYSGRGGINVIILPKDRETALALTQAQINRILQSIHFVQPSSSLGKTFTSQRPSQ